MLGKELDIIGNIYGDMEVIDYIGKTKNFVKIYRVKCRICNKEKNIQLARLNRMETVYHNNKESYLAERDGNIGLKINDYTIIVRCKDNQEYYVAKCDICGVSFRTTIGNFKKEYGTRHEMCTFHLPDSPYLKRFRKIYSCMRYRTTNPKYNEFYLYGGRGIKSEYFEDFIVFYRDMFSSYIAHCELCGENNTTIDRIDVNGDYTKDNCRWTTYKTQANNTRFNKYFKYDNKIFTLKQLCELLNLQYGTIFNRLVNLKWGIYESFGISPKDHTLIYLNNYKGDEQ